jgi:parvulin-like peptidyl-prolyl isomerase
MAVLGKIRDKSMLLIVVIALGLFAFVIDPTTIINFFNGSQNKEFVGKINGETIDRAAFANDLERFKQSRQGVTGNAALTQVWDQKVRTVLLDEEFDALGLSIEQDQLWDLIKQASANNPNYLNEAGVFDENILRDDLSDQIEKNPQFWLNIEKQYAALPKQQAYFNLVRAGIGATEKDGEQAYRLENDKVDLQFVQVPYATIPDSTITVSNQEITAYIKKNESEFEVEAETEINVVLFKEEPSEADDAIVLEDIKVLLNDRNVFNKNSKKEENVKGFRNTTDVALFLAENSEIQYDTVAKLKTQVYTEIADTIFKMEPGMLTDIYKQNGHYHVSRVMGFKKEEKRRASHVLVAYAGAQRAAAGITRTQEEAKAKADSLLAVIKGSSKDFADFAKESSDGPSASKGGDLDFFVKEGMVAEFSDFVFGNAVGAVGVVKTIFGYHIIKITDNKEEDKIQLATLALKINPSKETLDKLYRDAQNFEIEAAKGDFLAVAAEYNLPVLPVKKIGALADNLNVIPGNQRQLVKWTYNNDNAVGAVERFDYNQGHVVAKLVSRKAKGLAQASDVSVTVLPKIRKEKKAKMIRDKNAATTLADLAQNNNTRINTATAVTMKAPNLPGAGNEPTVVGAAFAMKPGEVSKLIDGERGVYVIEVSKITPAVNQDSYKKFADQTTLQNTNAVGNKILEALKKNAEIEDNRADIY